MALKVLKRLSQLLQRCYDKLLDEEAIVEVSNSPYQPKNEL